MKERPDVGVYIKDLSAYVVNNADDMDRIMTLGHKNRECSTHRDRAPLGWVDRLRRTAVAFCPTKAASFLIPFSKRSYLFVFRERGREKERKSNVNWWPLACAPAGVQATTKVNTLTGNRTGDLLLCRTTPNQPSHTSQGSNVYF